MVEGVRGSRGRRHTSTGHRSSSSRRHGGRGTRGRLLLTRGLSAGDEVDGIHEGKQLGAGKARMAPRYWTGCVRRCGGGGGGRRGRCGLELTTTASDALDLVHERE